MPRRRVVPLVEPDPGTQTAFRDKLESMGFQVWAAADGASGLTLAREHVPDVIVGDFPIDVPGESPFTAEVRRDERLSDTVIITVTGRLLTEKDSVAWLHSDCVLAKPIGPAWLAVEVAWAVERRRADP